MFRLIIRAAQRAWAVISSRSAAEKREIAVESYVEAGAQFGDALSYIAMGECVGFERMKKRWAECERKYAALGYRTLAIDDFIEHGGYGQPIDHLVRVERAAGEAIVYHAEVFDKRYKSGFKPKFDIDRLDAGPQTGHVNMPTTRDAEVHVRPKNGDAPKQDPKQDK